MNDNTITPVPAAVLSLGADPRSAGAARRFLAATLTTWKSTFYGDEAVLLLSELVANAALHARTQIGVRIELMPECLRLAVTDGSPQQPLMRHYSDEATTGRGLALVSALARRWGVEPNPDGTKTVWAEVVADPGRRKSQDSAADFGVPGAHGDPAGPDASSHRDEIGGEATSLLRAA